MTISTDILVNNGNIRFIIYLPAWNTRDRIFHTITKLTFCISLPRAQISCFSLKNFFKKMHGKNLNDTRGLRITFEKQLKLMMTIYLFSHAIFMIWLTLSCTFESGFDTHKSLKSGHFISTILNPLNFDITLYNHRNYRY